MNISSTVAVQNLCAVCILKRKGGVGGLKRMFDVLGGYSDYNEKRAERLVETAKQLPFMNG